MSAPDTNIERQTHRHKWSLWGIGIAVTAAAIFAAIALLSDNVPADEQAAGVPPQNAAAD
ncbi:hypothetical protein [Jannaschia sp. CCS1]|uniref:hypothetical protein n=1 Tax=Jannaschia sp. (strain CCS1) TaxID=290400 RepID=UPI0002F12C82|nr:hypothetical protein [Jannaschia sp. CCS1]